MEVLIEYDGKFHGALTINNPEEFSSPFTHTLFPCLIWDHEGCFNDENRSALAKALISAGCRYAVCGGKNCEAWHDIVDMEDLKRQTNDPGTNSESELVMTTWHDGESPDDVAFFFMENTDFWDHAFQRYLVLHIGTSEAKLLLDDAVRKYALFEKAGE